MKKDSTLLQRLKQNTPSKKLTWPGTEEEITLTVANSHVHATASLKAAEMFKDVHISYHNMDDFNQEKLVQLLHRCVSDSEGKTFCSISEFKALVNGELLTWLDEQHALLEEDYSPNVDNMSEDEFDKLVEDLKKKPEETLSGVCSIYVLRRLIMYLVSPVQSLQTDS